MQEWIYMVLAAVVVPVAVKSAMYQRLVVPVERQDTKVQMVLVAVKVVHTLVMEIRVVA